MIPEIVISLLLGLFSVIFGYLIKFKKMYFLIAGYSDLKEKKDFSKNQIQYANRIALSCFLFPVFLIGILILNYLLPLFPKQVINLDFFYILVLSLIISFLIPLLINYLKKVILH